MTQSQKTAIIANIKPEVKREGDRWTVDASTVNHIMKQYQCNEHYNYSHIVTYLQARGIEVKA